MKNRLIGLCIVCACCLMAKADDLKLWYQQPAKVWTEALPLGNSRLGAMVYGGVVNEQIQLNEETVWGGVLIATIVRRHSVYCPKSGNLFLPDVRRKPKRLWLITSLPGSMACLSRRLAV